MKRPPRPHLTHCLVLVNPSSTHYRLRLSWIDQLSSYFDEENIEVIDISQHAYSHSDELAFKLADKLDETTLIAIAGGDGTASLIINILLTGPDLSPKARRAVVLPLWMGNANDLAYMANGAPHRADVAGLMAHGRIAKVYPMAVSLKGSDDIAQSSLAVCYASFGASAHAAYNVSRPEHRQRSVYKYTGARQIAEMASVIRSLMSSRPFLSNINGRDQRLFDLIILNGSRMAKFGRLPIKLTEPAFYVVMMNRKHPILALYLARLAYGTAFRHANQTEINFTVQEQTWAQFDGEARKIAAGTQVNIKQNPKSFNLLTTKLLSS